MEIGNLKSKLVGNVHIGKQFSKEKCAYWKSEIRKFKTGNEKYLNLKLVMRKIKLEIDIGYGHGPSRPPYPSGPP